MWLHIGPDHLLLIIGTDIALLNMKVNSYREINTLHWLFAHFVPKKAKRKQNFR